MESSIGCVCWPKKEKKLGVSSLLNGVSGLAWKRAEEKKEVFFCTLAPGDCEMLLSIMLNAETHIHVQYMMYVKTLSMPI